MELIFGFPVYQGVPFAYDLIAVANPFADMFRWIGYCLLQCLGGALDAFYNAITTLLGINILEIPAVQSFIGSISPVAWTVLTVAIVFAAIALMIFPTKKEMFRGVALAVLLMIATPMIFTTLEGLKTASLDSTASSISESGGLGSAVLRSCTIDVAGSCVPEDPQIRAVEQTNSALDIYAFDINSRIPKMDAFNSKISRREVAPDGTVTHYGFGLSNGFFGWGEERLYAYQFDFMGMLIMMLIMLFSLFFSGFKIGKIIYELVVHQAIAPLVFASDIQGAGRTKKFLQSLVSNYIVLMMVLMLLKLYMSLMTWVLATDYDMWVKIFLVGGASWGIIDGPEIILKILGVDAGAKSATSMLMGAMAAGSVVRGAGQAVSGVAHAAAHAPQVAAGLAGRTVGAAQGIRNTAGNVQMGHTMATSPEARAEAGIDSLSDLRQNMGSADPPEPPQGAAGGDPSSAPGAAGGATPYGYNNTPQQAGYFARMRQNFTGARNRTADAIDRTAATAGYAAGSVQNRVEQYRQDHPPASAEGNNQPTTPHHADTQQYTAPPQSNTEDIDDDTI